MTLPQILRLVADWRRRADALGQWSARKAERDVYDYDMEFEAAKAELRRCADQLEKLLAGRHP